MKVLFVDFHAGCIQTLGNALLQAGHEVDVVSYSGHNHIMRGEITKRLIPTPFRYKGIYDFVYGTDSGYRTTYDVAIGTFPPSIYNGLLASGIAKQVLVYVNHRMDLHVKPAANRVTFWEKVKQDTQSGKIVCVAAHKFDAEYFKYYTGLEIKTVMPALLEIPEHTGERDIIIGPSHLDDSSITLHPIKHLGYKSIRQTYLTYELPDLAKHKAAIVLPYSSYSQSVLELSDLGLPLLIPSDEWLLDNGGLNDVRLAPLYTTEADGLEPQGSPNSPLREDRLHWAKYVHWRYLPNVYTWNNIDELRALCELDTYTNYQEPESYFFSQKRREFLEFASLDFLGIA